MTELPWRFYAKAGDKRGKEYGPFHAATRQAAMNQADRAWRGCTIHLQQINTGESWQRNRGSWFKCDPGHGRHSAAAAQADDGTHRP
jgi:hypothetical protein